MRRIATTIFALSVGLALTTAPVHAQTIGFKLGAAFAKWSADEDPGVELGSRTGFVGGGSIRFNFGRIGIQPEILSITKGAKLTEGSDDAEIGLEYVEIPVLIHLPLTTGMSFAPYLLAGPAIAFEVSCSAEFNDIEVDCDEEDLELERKSTDFGISIGGGLAFAAGPGAFLIEGRYTFGLSNINDTNDPTPVDIKNRAAMIMVGYEIPLGRR